MALTGLRTYSPTLQYSDRHAHKKLTLRSMKYIQYIDINFSDSFTEIWRQQL